MIEMTRFLLSRAVVAGAGAIVLSGCVAAAPIAAGMVAMPQPAADNAVKAPTDPQVGALTPRKLRSGECGLFLWSKSADRSLVFFNPRGGSGTMMLGGREVQLTRAAADGAEILGQFEKQTFTYDRLSIEIQIQFERRPGLARGAVVPQGALRLRRDDGWEYILPVGGLVGCEDV